MKQDGKLKSLIRQVAKTKGWTVEPTPGGGHLRLVNPEGEVVISPSTTGDRRTWLNTRACLRRIGWPH